MSVKSTGGLRLTIETDKSLYMHSKYNVGRLTQQWWVVGGICLVTNDRFLVTVENRIAKTLLPTITEHRAPGNYRYI